MSAQLLNFKATRSPVVRPTLQWLEAYEQVARTNFDFTLRLMFVWPRVFLRLAD